MKTLWVGNIEDYMKESDLFQTFAIFGKIVGITLLRPNKCGFVEFDSRQTAEHAAAQLNGLAYVAGRAMPVKWGKSRGSAPDSGLPQFYPPPPVILGKFSGLMPAPPGLEGAPLSSYCLSGLPPAAHR